MKTYSAGLTPRLRTVIVAITCSVALAALLGTVLTQPRATLAQSAADITLELSGSTLTEGESLAVTITVGETAVTDPIELTLTTADNGTFTQADILLSTDTATIASGETSVVVTIDASRDGVVELDESFVLSVVAKDSTITQTFTTLSITIQSNDKAVIEITFFDPNAEETAISPNPAGAAFGTNTPLETTIDGSVIITGIDEYATAQDWNTGVRPLAFTLRPSLTSSQITIYATNDGAVENDEQFLFELGGFDDTLVDTAGLPTRTFTIREGDTADYLRLAFDPVTVVETDANGETFATHIVRADPNTPLELAGGVPVGGIQNGVLLIDLQTTVGSAPAATVLGAPARPPLVPAPTAGSPGEYDVYLLYDDVQSPRVLMPGTGEAVSFTVRIVGDNRVEPDETYTLRIHPAIARVDSAFDYTTTVTIIDNDTATLTLSLDRTSIDESQKLSATISTAGAILRDSITGVVAVEPVGGGANLSDWLVSGVNFELNSTVGTITFGFTAIQDGLVENAEDFNFILRDLSSNSVYSAQGVGATIVNTDTAPLTLSVGSNSITESESLTVTVSTTAILVSNITASVSVNPASAGTFANHSDWQSLEKNFTIAANTNSTTVVFNPVNDTTVEGDENFKFSISLTGASSVTYAASEDKTVTVTSDDKATLTLTVSQSPFEEGQTVALTVATNATLEATISGTVNIAGTGFAQPANDWSSSSVAFELNASTPSHAPEVTVTDDTKVEDSESFAISVSGFSPSLATYDAATQNKTVTVTSDDKAVLTLAVNQTSFTEGQTAALTVATTTPLEVTINGTVNIAGTGFAQPANDWSSSQVAFTLNSSTPSDAGNLTVTDDTKVEDSESFTISVSGFSASLATYDTASQNETLTITDNDSASLTLVSNSAATVDEGSTVTYTVGTNETLQGFEIRGTLAPPAGTISAGSGRSLIALRPVLVPALTTGDYTCAPNPDCSFTLDESNLTSQIVVTLNSDATVEDAETLNFTAQSSSATNSSANTLTINDTDVASFRFCGNNPSTISAGEKARIYVCFDKHIQKTAATALQLAVEIANQRQAITPTVADAPVDTAQALEFTVPNFQNDVTVTLKLVSDDPQLRPVSPGTANETVELRIVVRATGGGFNFVRLLSNQASVLPATGGSEPTQAIWLWLTLIAGVVLTATGGLGLIWTRRQTDL